MGPDPEDNSRLVVNVVPFTEGDYWMHVFLGNVELEKSPLYLSIVKSDEHRRQEDMEKSERERLERERELRRLERLRKKKAQEEE